MLFDRKASEIPQFVVVLAIAIVLGLWLLARRRLVARPRPLLGGRSFSLLKIGLPTFVEGFLFCVVYVFLVKLILPFGVSGLASLGVPAGSIMAAGGIALVIVGLCLPLFRSLAPLRAETANG